MLLKEIFFIILLSFPILFFRVKNKFLKLALFSVLLIILDVYILTLLPVWISFIISILDVVLVYILFLVLQTCDFESFFIGSLTKIKKNIIITFFVILINLPLFFLQKEYLIYGQKTRPITEATAGITDYVYDLATVVMAFFLFFFFMYIIEKRCKK